MGSYSEIGQLQRRIIRGKELPVKMSHWCTTVLAEIFFGCLIERRGEMDAFAVVKCSPKFPEISIL